MAISSFRDLRVWRVGMDLVEQVYLCTKTFPKEEIYGLCSQMRRAAVSIPSNIADGHTRESTKGFLHFISIAQGSLAELTTQIELATRFGYLKPETSAKLLEATTSLSKQLYSLRNSLLKAPQPPTPIPHPPT